MLGPVMIGILAVSGIKTYRKKKAWTPAHEKVFIYHMTECAMKDGTPITANDLRTLAAGYEERGFDAKAKLLRKRAKLRELPEEVKQERLRIFRNVCCSTDPDKIEKMIAVYEEEGCMGTVATLKKYVQGLRAVDPKVRIRIADFLQQRQPNSEGAALMAENLRKDGGASG